MFLQGGFFAGIRPAGRPPGPRAPVPRPAVAPVPAAAAAAPAAAELPPAGAPAVLGPPRPPGGDPGAPGAADAADAPGRRSHRKPPLEGWSKLNPRNTWNDRVNSNFSRQNNDMLRQLADKTEVVAEVQNTGMRAHLRRTWARGGDSVTKSNNWFQGYQPSAADKAQWKSKAFTTTVRETKVRSFQISFIGSLNNVMT